MKKVMLFLALVSLISGLAQAQTPRIRQIWSKSIQGVTAVAFDPVSMGALITTKKGVLGFDSTGAVTVADSASDLKDYRPEVFSKNGRFVGYNRWPYHRNYRQLPPPFLVDRLGGRKILLDLGGAYEVVAISNDGESILMAKGLFYGAPNEPAVDPLSRGAQATLLFCEGDGRLIREVPLPGFLHAEISGDGNRVAVSVKRRKASGGWEPGRLIMFSRQGQMLWNDDSRHSGWFAVSDSGNVVSIIKRNEKMYARFYHQSGSLLSEIFIEKPSNPMAVSISSDGRWGVVVSRNQILCIESNSNSPRWLKTPDRGIVTSYFGPVISSVIAPEGDFIFISLLKQEFLILDSKGETLIRKRFESSSPDVWPLGLWGAGGHFLEWVGDRIALNQIIN